jgi:hypothetical protein
VILTDIIVTSGLAAIAGLVLSTQLRDLTRDESRFVAMSYAAHLVAAMAVLTVVQQLYGGIADYRVFRDVGGQIAEQLRADFWEVFPRTVLLFFHQETYINVPLNLDPRGGRATMSMWIIDAYGELLLFGSFPATAVACSIFSFSGKVAMYRAVRRYFPESARTALGMSILLVPSVVFWTSGLIKEGIAVGGLGFALLGFERMSSRRSLGGALPFVFGLATVALIKPYLLMPFAIGCAAWLYSARSRGKDGKVRIRPFWLVVGVGAAALAVILVGRAFPQFAVENFAENAAKLQFYASRARGGSYTGFGDPSDRTLAGQLRFAPLALFTALFRPLVFEARNGQMLVNSFETAAILGATLWLLAKKGWRWMVTTTLSNEVLAFSLSFVFPLALGVGLTTANLGTLSRYRAPLVPFLVLLVVTLTRARGDELVTAGRPRTAAAGSPPGRPLPGPTAVPAP